MFVSTANPYVGALTSSLAVLRGGASKGRLNEVVLGGGGGRVDLIGLVSI